MGQIQKMPNVEVFLDSRLTAAEVLEVGCDHVMIATGATWRRDGVGRVNTKSIAGSDHDHVFAPEAVMRGDDIPDPVVVFDDDHYYLGACAVEVLMLGDWRATAGEVGSWPEYGHLAGPTLGWKSHTGRPEHKRFVFPTRSMGAARRGASAVATI